MFLQTSSEKADFAAAEDADRDPGIELSGTSGLPSSLVREHTPGHKTAKMQKDMVTFKPTQEYGISIVPTVRWTVCFILKVHA